MIVAVAINPKGRDLCWDFFKENSGKLLEQYEVCNNYIIMKIKKLLNVLNI